MPEGPEIIVLGEYLKSLILNSNITNIISISKKKTVIPKKANILEIGTKGKLIWLKTKYYYIHILLKISGWIFQDVQKNTKYIMVFDNNTKIYIDDVRRLCVINIMNYHEHNEIINQLGIDICSSNFTKDIFSKSLNSFNINICAFLMNQYIFCGIGNYIKNESLYLAYIDPHRKSNSLTSNEILNLYNSIRFVYFSNLIEQLNDYNLTVNNFIKQLLPKYLEVPYNFKVYKQEMDPNGYKVKSKIIAGRNTYYVKELQI